MDKGRVDGVVDALARLAAVYPLPQVQEKQAPLDAAVDAFSSIEADTAWLLDCRDQLDVSTGRQDVIANNGELNR
ncbi:hypothetical protein FF124_11025 [Martelella lutilitoris]|uniref:Uncharacterized protein n=1 Tax=Martelella lutilitoris TaxID=2583532 RepID=A0A5C4JSB3_9HYPH|nr:hypothetical protein [Martelella lutilitoris]TNB48102.1 hypothetical protein FF124_11025 [Martelella lutilitoris]